MWQAVGQVRAQQRFRMDGGSILVLAGDMPERRLFPILRPMALPRPASDSWMRSCQPGAFVLSIADHGED